MSDPYSQSDAEDQVEPSVNKLKKKRTGSRGNRKAINARYYQRHKHSRRAYMKLWMRERRKNQQTNHEI